MQNVTFTSEEIEVLREVLRSKIDEIEIETFRADTHDFKQMLKRRHEILEHILARFSAAPLAA